MTPPSIQARHAAAADGCKAGWIALNRVAGGGVQARLCATAAELVAQLRGLDPQPQVLLIDMPIGLPAQGARRCDQLARQWLGVRRSSLFPAPIRPVLGAASWEQACAIREGIEGKRMSRQSWNITARVRELDALLQAEPRLQAWLREGHPELSFTLLAGAPLPEIKKTAAGKALRLVLVDRHFGAGAFTAVRQQFRRGQVGDDDILDAFAALWSAERFLRGEAITLPPAAEHDPTGLAMAITA